MYRDRKNILIEIALSIIVLIALWNLFQLPSAVNICVIFPIILTLITSYRNTYFIFGDKISDKKILFRITLLFALVPCILWGIKALAANEYLYSSPADDILAYKVKIEIVDSYNGGIGNEWSYNYFINGEGIKSKEIAEVSSKHDMVVEAVFCEDDPTYDDYGRASTTIELFYSSGRPKSHMSFSQDISVHETRGRGAGSSAKYKVDYTLERVVPPSYSFFEIIRYGNDILQLFAIACILVQAIAFFILLLRIIHAREFKKDIEKKERERQEKERLEQIRQKKELAAALAKKIEEEKRLEKERREDSIKKVLGNDNEIIVKIPEDVYFAIDGRPIKGKTTKAKPFGEYSVYITQNGRCYHESARCCRGDVKVVHVFEIQDKYSPCSKCVDHLGICVTPEWYRKVREIQGNR